MKEDLSILYVEDNAMSRTVMNTILQRRMKIAHVTLFEDSTDFMARVAQISPRPDIIFLDIHVEPLDGFAMLAHLRGSPTFANVKILAMTASVMNDEVERLRTAGFDGCIAKPLDKDAFPQQVDRILRGEAIWSVMY